MTIDATQATETQLLDQVVTALQRFGINPEVNREIETLEIDDFPAGPGPLTVIIMRRSGAVVVHYVHDAFLSPTALQRLIPAVALINRELDVSTVELNPEISTMSMRVSLEIADAGIDYTTLGTLLVKMFERLGTDWHKVGPALLALAVEPEEAVE